MGSLVVGTVVVVGAHQVAGHLAVGQAMSQHLTLVMVDATLTVDLMGAGQAVDLLAPKQS